MSANHAAWVRLCYVDDLPEIGARGFNLSGREGDIVFVVRKNDVLRGYKNSCPHWPGASLPWRKNAYLDAGGTFIICNGHGNRFEIETGLCVVGPCQGLSLTSIPLRVDRRTFVWADVSALDLHDTSQR